MIRALIEAAFRGNTKAGKAEGGSLESCVQDGAGLSPEDFFRQMGPLLRSLEKKHMKGVIHGDISPGNIICRSGGRMQLAGSAPERDPGSGRTFKEIMALKEGYAPPEQYREGNEPAPALDIYSLCATFYYCLSGTRPEPSLQRVLYDEQKPVDEVAEGLPEDICCMIEKGLSLRAEDRQQSVRELIDVIEKTYPPAEGTRAKDTRKHRLICDNIS